MRYQRQEILPDFGVASQNRLKQSSVLVIGCGGLSASLLPYINASGVGNIGIVDNDIIHLDNLHRQCMFNEKDIGKKKINVAKAYLTLQNSNTNISIYDRKCDLDFALEEFPKYDIIVEATDDINNKFLTNDVCAYLKKPMVYGAVFQYEGQLSVFHYGKENYSLRDVLPIMPKADELPTCAESGILPTLVGILGIMQANEVIKIIAGIDTVMSGYWCIYDTRNNEYNKLKITSSNIDEHTIKQFLNSHQVSGFPIAIMDSTHYNTISQHNDILLLIVDDTISNNIKLPDYIHHIPFYEFDHNVFKYEDKKTLIVSCSSGINSKAIATRIKNMNKTKDVYFTNNSIWNL